MSGTDCHRQLELFEVGRQVVTVDFAGGGLVSDAGLLPVAQLDRELGLLAEAARRLPDPRNALFVTHSAEQILRQQVFQILGGYPDGNDAQLLRNDPLFKTIVGVDPREEDRPLASGSTINRFQHAFTRREHALPIEDRSVIFEVRQAQIDRVNGLNEFLVDTFVRTRKEPLTRVVIDLDPTDDPAHGQQQLTFWHGYYEQNQYFPMLIFEGETGMPLGAWLRPGTVHASCGAVDMLRQIVERLRQHWPDVEVVVRGDNGVACPEMYDYCEAEQFQYAFGYATNEVLKRRVAELELEEHARLLWWMTGRHGFQLFHAFDDYQAGSWSVARRVVTKVEITKTGGPNIRHVVTNMNGPAADVYQLFYIPREVMSETIDKPSICHRSRRAVNVFEVGRGVTLTKTSHSWPRDEKTQRGNVPERPIGELKNGLSMDRLSSPRFLANAHKLMVHMLAYLLYSLFREANAATPELKTMEVGTARTRLFKVGALVEATHRRIWFHFASHWPGHRLLTAAIEAVSQYTATLHEVWRKLNLFASVEFSDPNNPHAIPFAPTHPATITPTFATTPLK